MSTAFLQFRLLRAAKFDSFVSGLSVLHGRLESVLHFERATNWLGGRWPACLKASSLSSLTVCARAGAPGFGLAHENRGSYGVSHGSPRGSFRVCRNAG